MKRTQAERQTFCEGAAARMTANPTSAEARLWEVLEPLWFQRQYPVAGLTKNGGRWAYILDFYHIDLKLCVEVDGGVHRKTKGRDRRRDARLAGEGIQTVRFTNKQIMERLEWVVDTIKLMRATFAR